MKTTRALLGLLVVLTSMTRASAQEVASRTLTDAVYQGHGVINLLKDINAASLRSYFNQNGGFLMLGADVNENQSGNENKDSLGVAIKQAQLRISTTNGDFTFGDFFTSTTAMLRENGSTSARQYQTLFGQAGSGTLTHSTQTFDISSYDDVLWLENINFTGDILTASLEITLLQTPTRHSTANEQFFDFSGGFEDFALLSAADAVLVENANVGTSALSSDISFSSTTNVTESLATNNVTTPLTNAIPNMPRSLRKSLGLIGTSAAFVAGVFLLLPAC